MEQLKKINKLIDWEGQLNGKTVFLRADLNVPIRGGVIGNDFRITSTLPTVIFLLKQGAKVIIASHIETADVEVPTLRPVYDYIKKQYPELEIAFCENFLTADILKNSLRESQIVLLENIRHATGDMSEKDNSVNLAMYLKEFSDKYINDAFAVSHRAHASVDALPKLFDKADKAAGLLLSKEIENLSAGLEPVHPLAVIISGMKFSTKLPLIQKYLNLADSLFIGGALFNNISKSLGNEVGASLVDTDTPYIDVLVKDVAFKSKVFIPDTVSVKNVKTGDIRICDLREVGLDESIQDIATVSVQKFLMNIQNTKTQTIVWNGPLGNFEVKEFSGGTTLLAEGLIQYARNNPDIKILIGGGDIVAAVKGIEGIENTENIFVSTGGGAMLEFLEKEGRLPGILSLQ